MTEKPHRVGVPVMKDVAQAAGVSHQTVSRVLNDFPHVGNETRRRVEKAVQQLGYVRNLSARALRTQKTMTIGMMAFEPAGYGTMQSILGAEGEARAAGYFMSVVLLRDPSVESVGRALQEFARQQVAGVVLLNPDRTVFEVLSEIDYFAPIVTVGCI